jgi:predicted enzyme related to lactoylglutathione lyase
MAAGDQAQELKHHYRSLEPDDPAADRFKHSTPIFRVEAMRISVDYYVKQLGFQLAWDWGDPPTFACVKRGDVFLFLCEGNQGARGTWLFIDVDDVDCLYDEYKISGAKIIQPPTNFPWGRREMNVEDPDGHRLRLASASTGEPAGVTLAT